MGRSETVTLRTSRLLLRPWRAQDLPAYAAMNADPAVRRWFPGTLSRADSDHQAARLQAHIEAHGFGFWAVEAPGAAPFIGFVGLQRVGFAAPFAPAVEAGWRLGRAYWGQGYASEAAHAALRHGFAALGLAEIVAFAVLGNVASTAVMQRIGMRRDRDGEFEHPALPAGHAFRRHVLYRAAPGDLRDPAPARQARI